MTHTATPPGMCARRAPNARELADVLANHTAAIAKAEQAQAEPAAAAAGSSSSAAAGPSTAPDFLAGLTAHDVLRNKGVPKAPSAAWLGALKQILPEAGANAVHAEHPSFRRLYNHLVDAEKPGSGLPMEGRLADIRCANGKRLGPARSKRLAKLIMAGREQAFETMSHVTTSDR